MSSEIVFDNGKSNKHHGLKVTVGVVCIITGIIMFIVGMKKRRDWKDFSFNDMADKAKDASEKVQDTTQDVGEKVQDFIDRTKDQNK